MSFSILDEDGLDGEGFNIEIIEVSEEPEEIETSGKLDITEDVNSENTSTTKKNKKKSLIRFLRKKRWKKENRNLDPIQEDISQLNHKSKEDDDDKSKRFEVVIEHDRKVELDELFSAALLEAKKLDREKKLQEKRKQNRPKRTSSSLSVNSERSEKSSGELDALFATALVAAKKQEKEKRRKQLLKESEDKLSSENASPLSKGTTKGTTFRVEKKKVVFETITSTPVLKRSKVRKKVATPFNRKSKHDSDDDSLSSLEEILGKTGEEKKGRRLGNLFMSKKKVKTPQKTDTPQNTIEPKINVVTPDVSKTDELLDEQDNHRKDSKEQKATSEVTYHSKSNDIMGVKPEAIILDLMDLDDTDDEAIEDKYMNEEEKLWQKYREKSYDLNAIDSIQEISSEEMFQDKYVIEENSVFSEETTENLQSPCSPPHIQRKNQDDSSCFDNDGENTGGNKNNLLPIPIGTRAVSSFNSEVYRQRIRDAEKWKAARRKMKQKLMTELQENEPVYLDSSVSNSIQEAPKNCVGTMAGNADHVFYDTCIGMNNSFDTSFGPEDSINQTMSTATSITKVASNNNPGKFKSQMYDTNNSSDSLDLSEIYISRGDDRQRGNSMDNSFLITHPHNLKQSVSTITTDIVTNQVDNKSTSKILGNFLEYDDKFEINSEKASGIKIKEKVQSDLSSIMRRDNLRNHRDTIGRQRESFSHTDNCDSVPIERKIRSEISSRSSREKYYG